MKLEPIHSSDQLIERAIAIADEGRRTHVAVAAAQDADVIGAVSQARTDGFLDATLVGDRDAIVRLADDHRIDLSGLIVVDRRDPAEAARHAVQLASDREAGAVMKGFLPTSALLKTVLDRRFKLRGKNTLSHCAVLDIPGYHKLLNFTDGGMIVRPDVEQKFEILENAMLVARALGLSPVKIAVSSASLAITETLPHTLTDVDAIIPRAQKEFDGIAIQGPLTLDVATDRRSAEHAGVHGPVVADADVYLCDSIEEGNIVSKSLIQFAGAVFAGVIVGAKVPVSLVSRTDTMKNKKASLALACVVADYYRQSHLWEEGN